MARSARSSPPAPSPNVPDPTAPIDVSAPAGRRVRRPALIEVKGARPISAQLTLTESSRWFIIGLRLPFGDEIAFPWFELDTLIWALASLARSLRTPGARERHFSTRGVEAWANPGLGLLYLSRARPNSSTSTFALHLAELAGLRAGLAALRERALEAGRTIN